MTSLQKALKSDPDSAIAWAVSKSTRGRRVAARELILILGDHRRAAKVRLVSGFTLNAIASFQPLPRGMITTSYRALFSLALDENIAIRRVGLTALSNVLHHASSPSLSRLPSSWAMALPVMQAMSRFDWEKSVFASIIDRLSSNARASGSPITVPLRAPPRVVRGVRGWVVRHPGLRKNTSATYERLSRTIVKQYTTYRLEMPSRMKKRKWAGARQT